MKITKNKIIIAVIALILIIAIVVLIIVAKKNSNTTKLKGDTNYKLDFTDKFVEDEYQKVTVTNISVADNFFFIKYDVDLTEKGIGLVSQEINNAETFSYELNRNIIINGDEIDFDSGYAYQIAEKISENKLEVYDIVQMESIPDKFNIDIEFIKTYEDNISTENMTLDEQVYKEHERKTQIREDGTYEYELEDEVTEDDELEEEVLVDENEEPEELQMDEIGNTLEIELAGLKNFKGTKEEAMQNVEIKRLGRQVESDNIFIKADTIVVTPFKSFLIVNSKINNLNEDESDFCDADLFKIDLLDENQNSLSYKSIQREFFVDKDKINTVSEEIGQIEIITIYALDDNILKLNNFYLQPYFYELQYEDDLNEVMNNLTWYSVENEEHEAINEFDGKVIVKGVERKDNQLYFNIEKEGFIPIIDRMIIIRNPENPLGYCIATESYKTDNGVCVYFEKKQIDATNENTTNNNLQYTIMEPINYKMATERIEVDL